MSALALPLHPASRRREGAALRIEAADVASLSRDERALIASSWFHRAEQEHLAVGAFSLLARELTEDGCAPIVLDLATRAAHDEARHTVICAELARAIGGLEPPARRRARLCEPMHANRSKRERVLLHVVEMCCLSETLSGVYLTEMAARTREPSIRAAVGSLLEDEIDHGRLGWAYLAERAAAGALGGLQEALPEIAKRVLGTKLDPKRASPRDAEHLEHFGYIGPVGAQAIYVSAWNDVVVPGFAAVGIRAPERSSLSSGRNDGQ